jgi:serine/threonine protein kinase
MSTKPDYSRRPQAHNILVDTRTGYPADRLFSAVDVGRQPFYLRPFICQGNLAYTNPEQTGRINHRVAFASDLYSLGIVFYEMLTGRLPFYSDDPLVLIHAHLAKEAPKVHEVNPNIPVALSKIVAKLMLKSPEKRYQSSGGLLADLIRCRDEFSAIGTIREFPLESSVLTQRVTFISKMWADKVEIILTNTSRCLGEFALFIFERHRQDPSDPGVAKADCQASGLLHSGSDVYQKNIPYSSDSALRI